MQVITDAVITVEGLYKEFGHGKVRALNGVDAQVRKGEVLVVIGPSGKRQEHVPALPETCWSCPPKARSPLKAWTSPTAR